MALTRSFRETIKEQLADSEFRREFLREAVGNMVAGDLETAKSLLREYINGTLGFVALGKALAKSPKSLMRMLSPDGNPQARNLFEMVAFCRGSREQCLKCIWPMRMQLDPEGYQSALLRRIPRTSRAPCSTA